MLGSYETDMCLALFIIMGFTGYTIYSKGIIKLPNKKGTQKGKTYHVMGDFSVKDAHST